MNCDAYTLTGHHSMKWDEDMDIRHNKKQFINARTCVLVYLNEHHKNILFDAHRSSVANSGGILSHSMCWTIDVEFTV